MGGLLNISNKNCGRWTTTARRTTLLDILKKEIQNPNKYSEKVKEEYSEMECEISVMEWITKCYEEEAVLIPVREEHFTQQSAMFLTKAEAKQHIELNHHHYSEQEQTYVMSA